MVIKTIYVKRPKPQEHWGWIIAIYLYLAGMGAGSYIIGTLLNWMTSPSRATTFWGIPIDPAKASLLWGPILVAIGAPFLILDLGIKKRFLYACLNPKTSWVARGFIILSVFIMLGLLLFLKSVFPFEWLHREAAIWYILEGITLAFAFATAIYTGILLKGTKSIPLWNTYFLPLLFLVSALSTGSMAIILFSLGTGLFSHDAGILKSLILIEQIFVVIEAIILYLYLLGRYRISEQGKDSVRLLLWGEKKVLFWGGIVLLGFFFPFVLEGIATFSDDLKWLIFLSGFTLLCGGFFLRLGVLAGGIKERIPMQRWTEFQYHLR